MEIESGGDGGDGDGSSGKGRRRYGDVMVLLGKKKERYTHTHTHTHTDLLGNTYRVIFSTSSLSPLRSKNQWIAFVSRRTKNENKHTRR